MLLKDTYYRTSKGNSYTTDALLYSATTNDVAIRALYCILCSFGIAFCLYHCGLITHNNGLVFLKNAPREKLDKLKPWQNLFFLYFKAIFLSYPKKSELRKVWKIDIMLSVCWSYYGRCNCCLGGEASLLGCYGDSVQGRHALETIAMPIYGSEFLFGSITTVFGLVCSL